MQGSFQVGDASVCQEKLSGEVLEKSKRSSYFLEGQPNRGPRWKPLASDNVASFGQKVTRMTNVSRVQLVSSDLSNRGKSFSQEVHRVD
jgi:hypothetical protein